MIGTMALIGLTLAAVGTATSVKGQLSQGAAANEAGLANQRAAEASAEVAESQAEQLLFNSGRADLQAADALQRGYEDETRYRTSVRKFIGQQRVDVAASNMALGVGSSLDVVRDSAHQGELDAITIRANAEREAFGHKTEAEDLRMGADIAKQGAAATRVGGQYAAEAGRKQRSAARWGAASTVIGSGTSLALQGFGWGDRGGSSTLGSRRVAGAGATYNEFRG